MAYLYTVQHLGVYIFVSGTKRSALRFSKAIPKSVVIRIDYNNFCFNSQDNSNVGHIVDNTKATVIA